MVDIVSEIYFIKINIIFIKSVFKNRKGFFLFVIK